MDKDLYNINIGLKDLCHIRYMRSDNNGNGNKNNMEVG